MYWRNYHLKDRQSWGKCVLSIFDNKNKFEHLYKTYFFSYSSYDFEIALRQNYEKLFVKEKVQRHIE